MMKRNDDPPNEDHGEAMGDAIYEILKMAGLDPESENAERAFDEIWKMINQSYTDGYRQGIDDESYAQAVLATRREEEGRVS